jgi:hypothetical protein
MIRLYKGPTDNARVVKYHIVIFFPQLSAEEITSCTKCARLVGSLTVGNELDDLVHQTVLAYVKARGFPSFLFFLAHYQVVQRVESQIDVGTSEHFKAEWEI